MPQNKLNVTSKKVLQINAGVGFGSTGKIVESIGRMAMKNGYDSYAAYGRVALPSELHLLKIGSKCDPCLHYIRSLLFDAHGLGSHRATCTFLKEVEKLAPDIIHLHNIHGYYLNIIDLFAFLKEYGRPVVWTFHDFWPITGHCAHFTSAKCVKWKRGCRSCPIWNRYPKSITDNSSRNYKLKQSLFSQIEDLEIVTVSHWQAEMLKESFLGGKRITTIYNGINLDTFKPVDVDRTYLRDNYGINTKINLLGVATSWSRRKGLERFVELRRLLPEEIGIVLVGLSEKQAKELPAGIVGIHRTSDQSELAHLYSMADIVMNLSEEETFGLTTVEGFACGTPGIVMETTASPELVTPQTGLVASHNDIHNIEQSVYEILRKGKVSYTIPCRERACDKYDQKKQWMKYIDIYNNKINTSATR